jgi:pyruvate/2-oxoglutarate dehydrogenase complex dihydrolipoamide dehydrogenase (E3) component
MAGTARIAYDVRRAHDYGIELSTAGVAVDMHAVQARKRRIVDASRTGLENWVRGLQNCTVYQGHARFESARSVILRHTVHIHPTVSELIPTVLGELVQHPRPASLGR